MPKRITKDEYFLALAQLVSVRATCDRLWAGCVLVKDGEILSTGYNGAPSGAPECDETGHLLVEGTDGRPHCFRAVHAEINALFQSRKRVNNLVGVTAYINTTPCINCLTELLRSGIRRIVVGSVYSNAEGDTRIAKLTQAFGAILECSPSPEITLSFPEEVGPVMRVTIEKL